MSHSKKKSKPSKSKSNLSPNYLPPISGVHAPPEVGAPVTPALDAPVIPNHGRNLGKPARAQLDAALAAADELRASTTFPEVVGARLARADDVANALEFAAGWSREAKAATAWRTHARDQAALAWDYALKLVEKVRPTMVNASNADATVVSELQAFTRLLSARGDAVKRGHAKRVAAKRAEAKNAKAASAVVAPSPTSVIAAAPVAAAPVVTNGLAAMNGASGASVAKA